MKILIIATFIMGFLAAQVLRHKLNKLKVHRIIRLIIWFGYVGAYISFVSVYSSYLYSDYQPEGWPHYIKFLVYTPLCAGLLWSIHTLSDRFQEWLDKKDNDCKSNENLSMDKQFVNETTDKVLSIINENASNKIKIHILTKHYNLSEEKLTAILSQYNYEEK
ncbi:hypothetical protein [Saccharicrinis sp. GN24d3]|uniref:hypothetical protein n=1 Tax=Saccharicrinis sp. GN24d3 TaxID=3458416 RepID=UPI0040355A3F